MARTIDLTILKKPQKMSSYFKKSWRIVGIVALSGLLFDGCMSFIPILQGQLLDAVIYNKGTRALVLRVLFFLSTVIGIQGMRAIKRFYVREFANRTGALMRREVYHAVMHRGTESFLNEEAGDLMNKAVNDVDLCVEGMRKVTTEFFDTGVLMLGYLTSLFIYDIKITLSACTFIPVAMLIAGRMKTVVVRFNKEARAQSSITAQAAYSNIDNIKLYRIFGVMQKRQEEYDKELAKLERKSIRANVLENSMQPLYHAITMLGIGAVIYFGGHKVIDDVWSVGTLTAYITIFTALAVKTGKASQLFNSFQKSVVSWKRIRSYLVEINAVKDISIAKEVQIEQNTSNTVEVRNLTFSYPSQNTNGKSETILSEISFSMKKGQFLGITGAIASGKSTLGLALTGIYPYSGEIFLDGLNIATCKEQERSQKFSYQGHEPQLLSDTIYRNITLGQEGDISDVLRDVCFDEDLQEMPDNIDTIVGNHGIRLSGGQQARIALARALWHQAPIMILDDPFSAVDTVTEQKIIMNLREHYPERTFIIMSHRLKYFPGFEKIMYLKDGKATLGQHDTLLQQEEGYRERFLLQQAPLT